MMQTNHAMTHDPNPNESRPECRFCYLVHFSIFVISVWYAKNTKRDLPILYRVINILYGTTITT